MAINRDKNNAKRSEQNVLNSSYDEDFDVLAFELLAYDSVNNVLRRVTTDALSHFGTNHVDKADSTTVYEGLEDCDGNWQIVKTVTSGTVTTNTFATKLNNSGVSTYADAWAARATTLTYGTYSEAF